MCQRKTRRGVGGGQGVLSGKHRAPGSFLSLPRTPCSPTPAEAPEAGHPARGAVSCHSADLQPQDPQAGRLALGSLYGEGGCLQLKLGVKPGWPLRALSTAQVSTAQVVHRPQCSGLGEALPCAPRLCSWCVWVQAGSAGHGHTGCTLLPPTWGPAAGALVFACTTLAEDVPQFAHLGSSVAIPEVGSRPEGQWWGAFHRPRRLPSWGMGAGQGSFLPLLGLPIPCVHTPPRVHHKPVYAALSSCGY